MSGRPSIQTLPECTIVGDPESFSRSQDWWIGKTSRMTISKTADVIKMKLDMNVTYIKSIWYRSVLFVDFSFRGRYLLTDYENWWISLTLAFLFYFFSKTMGGNCFKLCMMINFPEDYKFMSLVVTLTWTKGDRSNVIVKMTVCLSRKVLFQSSWNLACMMFRWKGFQPHSR